MEVPPLLYPTAFNRKKGGDISFQPIIRLKDVACVVPFRKKIALIVGEAEFIFKSVPNKQNQ